MPHDWKAASLNDVSKVVREVDYRAVINTKNLMETREELNQLKLLPKQTIENVECQTNQYPAPAGHTSTGYKFWANAITVDRITNNMIKGFPKQIDMWQDTDEFYTKLEKLG